VAGKVVAGGRGRAAKSAAKKGSGRRAKGGASGA